MSLGEGVPNFCRILNDLTLELDVFTKYKHQSNVRKIVNSLYDIELTILVKVILTLRKINAEDLIKKKDKHALYYRQEIYKLIKSRNFVDDGDTHPIGQDFSIFSCASKSQDVLNVKRLSKKTSNVDHHSKSPLVNFVIEELNFKNESIEPTVKDSSLHTHEVTWFRLVLTVVSGDLLDTFKELYDQKLVRDQLCDVNVLAEEFNVIELYYKKAKVAQLIDFFETCDLVQEIVFCSELELMKKLRIRQSDIFSNMLKFYYCYKTNHFTFTVISQENLRIFHYVYLMCSIFIHSSKFTTPSGVISPAPISSLSYYKPMINIQPKAKMVEDLSVYEHNYIRKNGVDKLCNTASSLESYRMGKRHTIYTVTQDRDKRILHNFSNVGGVNQSELVIEPQEERAKRTVKLLRKMSV